MEVRISNPKCACASVDGLRVVLLGLSLHNTGTTHRWSDGNDRDGKTLCVQWSEASQKTGNWNDWTFIPIQIKGRDTSANILAACKAAGLETPCDHPAYSDGKCQTIWNGHLSQTPSHSGFTLTDNKFFYAGVAQGGMSLGSTVVSHRWATEDNVNGQSLCVSGNNKRLLPQQWLDWWWVPTQIKGVDNSANILNACKDSGMQTPCDHPSYNVFSLGLFACIPQRFTLFRRMANASPFLLEVTCRTPLTIGD
jgi:hypothetical protein